MYKVGTRVGAILSSNPEEVKLLGYGVYEGDEVPPTGLLHDMGMKNPKIKLDNGNIVWGCECWWGPEDKIKDSIKDKKVVEVDIPKEEV